MTEKVWKLKHNRNTKINSIEDVMQTLLTNRNLLSQSDIANFMAPQLSTVNYAIGDMEDVIKRLIQAINSHEKIVVYGDYDADGVTASAIMWEGLYQAGANTKPYIPHREREGYGMSQYGIDYLIEHEQVKLIVTVDQGISAKKQIEYARSRGIDVIVTDHHTKPADIPTDCLIVHDHTVSGAAVAWKVIAQLLNRLEGLTDASQVPTHAQKLLELVAIGIICDLVPLKGDARTLVYHGLEQLKKSEREGLRAIARAANFSLSDISTYHIGFVIGPRINATGRLEHAMDSLRLLCTKTRDRADELARKVNDVNTERKELTLALINEARYQAEQKKYDPILIVGSKEWNPGVIGLVASRLVEEFYKPTIVWGTSLDHEELYKASARSIKGFNIIDAITQAHEHLLNFGGHPMAAGFSLNNTKLADFEKAMHTVSEKMLTEEILTPSLDIDLSLPIELATLDLHERIQSLKPFGVQADEPIFTTEQMTVEDIRALGTENKHLKLKMKKNALTYDAIAFGMGMLGAKIRPGDTIDLAYTLDNNEWKGKSSLQLKVKDIHINTV